MQVSTAIISYDMTVFYTTMGSTKSEYLPNMYKKYTVLKIDCEIKNILAKLWGAGGQAVHATPM